MAETGKKKKNRDRKKHKRDKFKADSEIIRMEKGDKTGNKEKH